MAQVTHQQAPASGTGVPASGSIDEQIAEIDRQLKESQHRLAQLTARKSAQAAFEQERKTSSDALNTAQEKVSAAEEQAGAVLRQADDVKEALSPLTVKEIDDAIAAVDQDEQALRERVSGNAARIAVMTADETTAKANSQNARAATAEAKRQLAERTRAIEVEINRMNRLATDAKTAITQKQHRDAYLLLQDLRSASQRLTALNDDGEIDQLKQAVRDAIDGDVAAAEHERDLTWELSKTKADFQADQAALAAAEANRRKSLDEAVKAAGGEQDNPGAGAGAESDPAQQTQSGQPATQAAKSSRESQVSEYE